MAERGSVAPVSLNRQYASARCIFGQPLNHRLVSHWGPCGMSTACHGVGTEWPASEFASKRSGATQHPRREEHAAPPAGNPAVAVVGRRYRQKSLLTLRRVKHSEGGRRCLFNIAHFKPAQQRTHCITFTAICSMLLTARNNCISNWRFSQ